jgi:small nuclear ribonucleoprotein (snRNP)-like protein
MNNRLDKKNIIPGFILGLLIIAVVAGSPGEAAAKRAIVEIKGMNYEVESQISDNLRALAGKQVSVVLVSGKVFTGLVKKIGTHLIHLEKLKGKEYYDALIRIRDICAIEAMFRKYKR